MLLNSPELFGTPKHYIMDPIHGGIPLFTHESEVIDHPLFLRLRHVKENDILFFVFPGATHSRFEHCIGTMHVACRIFKGMLQNYFAYRCTRVLEKNEIEAIQYILGCLRLAALLHDVGHMPFSHQFEESIFGKHLLKDSDFIKELFAEKYTAYISSLPSEITHEHYSLICAIEILTSIKNRNPIFPVEIEDVIGIMENGSCKPSSKFINHSITILGLFIKEAMLIKTFVSKENISLKLRDLFKSIISGEIDADKMDYLLRDSYFSGVKYGIFNIDHLIKNIYTGWDIQLNPWVGIAINEKGKGAFEDFVHSRFQMYLQVYNHKSVANFKWILRQAVFELSENVDTKLVIRNSLVNLKEFADFTDTFFWEKFREFGKNNDDCACSYIIKRIKLKFIKSIRVDGRTPFVVEREVKNIKEEINKEIITTEAPSKFSKINPDYDKIRLLKFNKINNTPSLDSINSEFFERSRDVIIKHVFIAPSFKFI